MSMNNTETYPQSRADLEQLRSLEVRLRAKMKTLPLGQRTLVQQLETYREHPERRAVLWPMMRRILRKLVAI